MTMPIQESLTQQVHELLGHLYDFAYLQQHPLSLRLAQSSGCDSRQAMRRLRTILLETIEELCPGPDAPREVAQTRLYTVLRMHYVDAMQIKEVADEIGISRRQVFRNLRSAEERLTDLLWPKLLPMDHARPASVPQGSSTQTLQHETQRLSRHAEPVHLDTLLAGAIKATRPLASQHGVTITVEPAGDIIINTRAALARQLLVSLLSYVIQQARQDSLVTLTRLETPNTVSFCARFEPSPSADTSCTIPRIATHLLQQLGGRGWLTRDGQHFLLRFALHHSSQATVLVIDDNASMADLVRRYLVGTPYHVVGASNGADGLDLSKEILPSAILLDVMMPDQDGWEILQLLQAEPATQSIPIIVCSVFDDPELAVSLGASGFLPKPVSRAALLEQLDIINANHALRSISE